MEEIQELKLRLREESSPFFTDEELHYYFSLNNNDLDKTTYDSITLPGGLTLANNREYWLGLAKLYKPKKRSFVL